MMKQLQIVTVFFLISASSAIAQLHISNKYTGQPDQFAFVDKANTAKIVYDTAENILVKKAAEFLSSDIEKVTGKKPLVSSDSKTKSPYLVVVATVGNNPLINQLIAQKKLDVSAIKGGWEQFIIQSIKKPFPGVEQALVIVGSDRRGAAYGVFTLSEKMGVSPWYWWADAPVERSSELYLTNGIYTSKGPSVKYRGIFINDEAPAFRNWAIEKFGGINHKVYEKIYELLLRNKANYLWPSMWLPTMFNVDDPLNPKTADEFGIVVSTSHHEPMMRAHNEWSLFNGGAWNYNTNKDSLQKFWRGGVERMGNYESVVTVGMRGDGDEGMAKETAVDLLQTIIKDQRKIIAEVTGKPAAQTPQVWAIYKEVQDYYDKGMRVDDDITILFSDDNWGNIRYLPKAKDLGHKGGYGMYYHLDYVGSPVSYRWQNVTQIERIWEQMKITYEHGVKNLWIANVGDIKPMELPISFFLDYAWDPEAIQAKDLPDYYVNWAAQQFGDEFAKDIANILALYTKYNARRTPEMLTAETYSVENYREAESVLSDFNALVTKGKIIYDKLDSQYKDPFYQLILSPVEMCANVNEMYIAAGKNKYYADRGASPANFYADRVKILFEKDAELTQKYHQLQNGKWNHMMSQTHMGYTSWAHPPLNKTPPIAYVQLRKKAELGYFLEYGSTPFWGWLDVEADWSFSESFQPFDSINKQDYYIDVVNRGQEHLSYSLKAQNDWIELSKDHGTTQFHEKVYVSINWAKVPKGQTNGTITISGAGAEYNIKVPVINNLPPAVGFVENNGVVSMEAAHFTNKKDAKNIYWKVVPNLGRTESSIIAEPVTAGRQAIENSSPYVEYDFTVFNSGELNVDVFMSPTQDFKKQGGLQFALSIDNEKPTVVNLNEGEVKPDYQYAEWWSKSVGDHIKIKRSKHTIQAPGKHTLKLWMIDPGIVFQKLVIYTKPQKRTYLGPPEK